MAMNKPAEIWNAERLEQAMLAEAASHGASQRDRDLLRAEFEKARVNNNRDVFSNDDICIQAGEIPA
jgi:hypothetical protein